LGNPTNLAVAIAVYASISKKFGVPLRFPAKPGAYDALLELTDAGLLARQRCGRRPRRRRRTRRSTSRTGPVPVERAVAAAGRVVRAGGRAAAAMSLADVMADKEPLWKELSEVPFDAVSSWPFADFVFGWDYDFFADSSKIRRAGFHEYVDTPEMFFGIFAELRERHVIR
jgi:hypothetical protein